MSDAMKIQITIIAIVFAVTIAAFIVTFVQLMDVTFPKKDAKKRKSRKNQKAK